MFELDMDSDFEQAVGRNSFATRGPQSGSEPVPAASASHEHHQSSGPAQAASASVSDRTVSSVGDEITRLPVQMAQHAQPPQQPMPDSVPVDALSPVPILGPVPDPSGPSGTASRQNQQEASIQNRMSQLDLEDIVLGVAKGEPVPVKAEGQAAADEWEEVNLARAREMAVDTPAAAIPGDKVQLTSLTFTCMLGRL